MAQVGIRELRDHLTAIIRRVRGGETIEITHHDEPVAVLMPARASRLERLQAASDITPGRPLAEPIRRRVARGGASASAALEEDRSER